MAEEQLIVCLQKLYLDDKPEESEPAVEVTESPSPTIEEAEEIIGYKFRNRELLKEAFSDASFKSDDCRSYERLEYFGDSVLNFMIAKEHYFLYPEMAPGELTRLRAANVDTEALARVALKHNLHKFLNHRKPLLEERIQEFMKGIEEYPSHSYGMIDPPKVLADIFESLVGAIFIDTDSSIDATWEIVKRLLQPLTTPENLDLNPATKFNEACQKTGVKAKAKDLWAKTGVIEIFINNELVGRGDYKRKRTIAMNRAAADAYKNFFQKRNLQEFHTGC